MSDTPSTIRRYWHGARRAVGLGFGRTIEDGRGRVVTPWLSRPWWGGESKRSPIPSATLERVVRRIRPGFSFRRRMALRGAFWVFFIVAWCYIAFVVWKVQAGNAFMAVTALAIIVFGIVARYLGRRAVPREIPIWEIRDAMVAEGLCASCGYPIRGLEVEADGCAVCPECGAAWRVGAAEAV